MRAGGIGARATRAALALALAGCGAKTGLLLPDTGLDAADVVDAADVAVACVPGQFRLEPRRAEVMLVVDRSRSMNYSLDGLTELPPGSPATRWNTLRGSLETALAPYQSALDLGAAFYPQPVSDTASLALACSAAGRVDVEPAPDNAAPILRVFRTTRPNGGTPTFSALRLTGEYLAARASRGAARFIVLATDGAPNCNLGLDGERCVCTSFDDAGRPACANTDGFGARPHNCLDRDRTLAEIRTTVQARGIPVFVIGMVDETAGSAAFRAVLAEMARTGGRPRPGSEPYYSARSPDELRGAFDTIQRSIARCAFVTPSRPDDPDAIAIDFAGATVPRDPSRTDGWDWTDAAFGEITLFGAACEAAAARPTAPLTARVTCRDGG